MPRLAIDPKVGRRIRTLRADGKSGREISAAIEAEFGTKLDRRTIDRHLQKHPPGKPKRTARAPTANAPPNAPPSGPAPRSRSSSASSPASPPPPPPTSDADDDLDDLAELRADARRLRQAIDAADDDSKNLAALIAEHRKVLAAIRAAKGAGARDFDEVAREAAAVRQRLAAYVPPSPPTFAEQERARSALPDEPGAPAGAAAAGAA